MTLQTYEKKPNAFIFHPVTSTTDVAELQSVFNDNQFYPNSGYYLSAVFSNGDGVVIEMSNQELIKIPFGTYACIEGEPRWDAGYNLRRITLSYSNAGFDYRAI